MTLEKLRHTLFLQWIRRRLALWHVDYSMYIERDLLSTRRPVFVAEAVSMLAVILGIEGMVARGHGGVVYDVRIRGVHDLQQ